MFRTRRKISGKNISQGTENSESARCKQEHNFVHSGQSLLAKRLFQDLKVVLEMFQLLFEFIDLRSQVCNDGLQALYLISQGLEIRLCR